jgi:hypothetical protein
VREGGHQVHPYWPLEILQTDDEQALCLLPVTSLSLCVLGEGLHNLPDSGDDPHRVAAHHQHHYVHTDAGQQHLTLTNIPLFPQCIPCIA